MIRSPPLQMGGAAGGRRPFAFLGPFVGRLITGTAVYLLWSSIGGSSPTASTRQADTTETLRNATETLRNATETLRKRDARSEVDGEALEERARTLRER